MNNSFLSKYRKIVINNGVDLDKIKHVKVLATDKKIILGVASTWDSRKGLDDFLELNTIISDDYQRVMIGLSKHQISHLPKSIIGLQRTDNFEILLQYYSSAYVFFNPSREDNYPTVNLESIACGTPVITYDLCGCKETVQYNTGIALKTNSVIDVYKLIDDENLILSLRLNINSNTDWLNSRKKYMEYYNLYRECLQ